MWRDEALALDMLISARKASGYLGTRSIEGLLGDSVLQDAIARQLGVLGEAAARVSDDFRLQHVDVPWREIVGMRNRLVHDYWNVDAVEMWRTVVNDLPPLIGLLERITPAE